jgi:DNA-directed RNA polymerase subunit M/transcription elongation factor TFIIS
MTSAPTCPRCGGVLEPTEQSNDVDQVPICPRCHNHDPKDCALWDQYCHETPLPAEV